MKFPLLESDRLILRQITEKDASFLFEYLSQVKVTKYYGMDALRHIDGAQNLINKFQENLKADSGIRWGIIEKKSSNFIGTIGFNGLNKKNQRTEVGYDLNPKFWRKGYATEALSAVIAYGFMEMNLHRIGAIVFPENTASKQLLMKTGFNEEGLLREYIFQNDSFHDTIMFSLLKNEWVTK